jgi:uncharacterized protein
MDRRLTLVSQPGIFAVCRLPADAEVPAWATAGSFFSITRTPEELSIICDQEQVPDGHPCEGGWFCLQVAGTLDGVLASLLVPLTEAGVSVVAVSTFDTDYLLIRHADLVQALLALRGAGHFVQAGG